jgi:hypothetical protein
MPCQIFPGCSVKKYREKGENGGQIMKKHRKCLDIQEHPLETNLVFSGISLLTMENHQGK